MRLFNKVAIVGVGLIGGSLGMALRRKRLAGEVTGVFRRKISKVKAIKAGAVNRGTLNLEEGLKDADLVILATPICEIIREAKDLVNIVKEGCILTDVGSTKVEIVEAFERLLPKDIYPVRNTRYQAKKNKISNGVYFIGGHPLAGSERKGVTAAKADLFEDSICILTKTKDTHNPALNIVKALWKNIGARVQILSPKEHDRIVSDISHLPHIVAISLINTVDSKALNFASSGFKDTTRIASSDPTMWRDICITNNGEIINSIRKFEKALKRLKKSIANKKAQEFFKEFEKAKLKRDALSNYCH